LSQENPELPKKKSPKPPAERISPKGAGQIEFCSRQEEEVGYLGEAGGGKAQRLDSLVCTPYGFKRMGDMKIGTKVSNPDGSVSEVIQIHPQGEKEFYRLTFSDGTSTECTLDHIWYGHFKGKSSKVNAKYKHNGVHTYNQNYSLKEIISHYEKKLRRRSRFCIPLTKPVLFLSNRKDDPYLIGLLLGDGYCGNFDRKKHSGISLTTADQEILDYVKDQDIHIEKRSGCNQIRFRGKSLRKIQFKLKELGIFGKRSWEKSIPENWKRTSIEFRTALLQGLMDTDGTVGKEGKLSFTSTSKQLAEDVAWIFRSLGGFVSISERMGKYKKNNEVTETRPNYTLYIKHPNPSEFFRLSRKKARCKAQQFYHKTIDQIELIGKDECQCITVRNPNGLYITNDFTVTHNSFCLLMDSARYVDYPDYRAIIFRRSYPEMENLIDTGRKIFGPLGGKFNKNDFKFKFPSGAQVFLGYLESEEDVWRYQGREYAYIAFDEVTHIRPPSYQYLISSRLRSPNPNIIKRVRCTANPDGPYVLFYYERFVKKLAPGEVKWFDGSEDNEVPQPRPNVTPPDPGISRLWIECKRSENLELMKTDPGYENRLNNLPEEKRNALKYGLWVFTDDPLILVKSSWLNKARTGQYEYKHGHYTLGMDFAMGSTTGDKCVFFFGVGNRVTDIRTLSETDHVKVAQYIHDEMKPYGWQMNAGIDAQGTGAGVYPIIADKFPFLTDRIIPLGTKDRHFDEVMKLKYSNRLKFLNFRSQVFWRLREDFERGDIDLSQVASHKEMAKLIGDLSEIRWDEKNGFVVIESKEAIRKRLKRSTDHADAFAYWNWARHQKIELPPIDMDDRERESIDYGIHRDDTNYSNEYEAGEGSFTDGDAGSWA